MSPIDRLKAQLDDVYSDNFAGHGLDHIRRVTRNAEILGKREGADMDVLLPAAMLHDIALKVGSTIEIKRNHANLGAEMAAPVLEECGFSGENIKKICSAIRQHSKSSDPNEPRTLEGNCLFDADKLDAVTPCGVARYILQEGFLKNMPPVDATKRYLRYFEGITKSFKTKSGSELCRDLEKAKEFCAEIIRTGKI